MVKRWLLSNLDIIGTINFSIDNSIQAIVSKDSIASDSTTSVITRR